MILVLAVVTPLIIVCEFFCLLVALVVLPTDDVQHLLLFLLFTSKNNFFCRFFVLQRGFPVDCSNSQQPFVLLTLSAADIFVAICPMLKMYTDYVTKHETALDTYAELRKDPKFVEFDNMCQVFIFFN